MNFQHSSIFALLMMNFSWTLPQGYSQSISLLDPQLPKLAHIALLLYVNLSNAPILVHLEVLI